MFPLHKEKDYLMFFFASSGVQVHIPKHSWLAHRVATEQRVMCQHSIEQGGEEREVASVRAGIESVQDGTLCLNLDIYYFLFI